ncbi:MAG: hypothetical protein N2689_16090 [Verrucomicrobiae bacterium]|nr:hypothetical protein [Verrucomicrobiae bacterium]
MRKHLLAFLVAASVGAACGSAWAEPKLPDGWKLLYSQTFASESAMKDFEFTDPNCWRLAKDDGGNCLEEFNKKSSYKPKVRSPFHIALIRDRLFGDFVLEAELLSTVAEYGHRDMCLFFGFVGPEKFYYCHMASKADPNAHNVFIVNDAPRAPITKTRTNGVKWGEGVWHKIRLERRLADGTIKLYFDDSKEPIMCAEDKTFGEGRIGFGTFDDTGKFRNINVWGPSMKQQKTPAAFGGK